MSAHKPLKKLVGLRYDLGVGVPHVIVKSSGAAAEALLRRHDERNDPPLIEDPALIEQLYRLPVDARIGSELFQVVAVLLAYVHAADRRTEEEPNAWTL